MSNNQKNVTATVEEKKSSVPSQKAGDNENMSEAIAADTMIDALKKIEDRLAEGVTVTIKVHENGAIDLDVVEDDGKMKKLVNGAKGLFQRNKKLVIATGALTAASVILKVIASRQELEADEVVESSDDVSPDA